MNFAFAGCGFMGIYHIGVASCLRQNAPHLLDGKLAGASAGAMVACLVLCDCPLGLCTKWTIRLATKARSRSLGPMHPTFDITQLLREGLHEILPANAHEIVNGRLHVSMTRVSDGRNIMVKDFSSREELIQALLCSAYIPFYSGLVPPLFRGERCIDGALSDNLPIIDEHTVTVSPFAGRSDICPDDDCANFLHVFLANTSIQFSVANLYRLSRIMFPPHPEKLRAICQRGFDDTLLYLKRNELMTCMRHINSQPRLLRTRTVYRGLDELDGTNRDRHGCPDCASTKEKTIALLPKTVLSALNEAIELVNSSYVLYLKNTKFYRTFSIMCSPLYLPIDIALLSLSRLLHYMPQMTSDLGRLLRAVRFYLGVLAKKLADEDGCSYTARLVCHLAISEIRKDSTLSSQYVESGRGSRGRAVRSVNIGFDAGLTSGSLRPLSESGLEDDGRRQRRLKRPLCEAEAGPTGGAAAATAEAEHAAEPTAESLLPPSVVFSLDSMPIRSRACSLDGRQRSGGASAPAFGAGGGTPPTPRSRTGSVASAERLRHSNTPAMRPSRADSSEALGGVASGAVLGYYCAGDDGHVIVTELYNVSELLAARLELLAAAAATCRAGGGGGGSGSATPRSARPLHRTQAGLNEEMLTAALCSALSETAAKRAADDVDADAQSALQPICGSRPAPPSPVDEACSRDGAV